MEDNKDKKKSICVVLKTCDELVIRLDNEAKKESRCRSGMVRAILLRYFGLMDR